MEKVWAVEEFSKGFFSLQWSRLLWCCPLAPLLCWHLSMGCGAVHDQWCHRSASEWLISSELCCPTSEYACTLLHNILILSLTFNNAVQTIETLFKVYSVCDILCFMWEKNTSAHGRWVNLNMLACLNGGHYLKLLICYWKHILCLQHLFFLGCLRFMEHQGAFRRLNEEMWYLHSVISPVTSFVNILAMENTWLLKDFCWQGEQSHW